MLSRRSRLIPASRARQRGDILLVTMVFLLLCLLGLIGGMRDTIAYTTQASNTLARQRDTQVTDMAIQSVRNLVLTNAPAGLPLTSATNVTSQTWWRAVAPTASASLPAGYWSTCLGNSVATARCGSITLQDPVTSTALPYTVLAVVQPTGRTDPNSVQCNVGNGLAQSVFYAIFVHVVENNGLTSVDTESVLQACEQKSS